MQFFRFNLVVSAAILLMAGMLVAGCSKKRRDNPPPPLTNPNGGGGTNTPKTGPGFTDIILKPPTVELEKGQTFTFTVVFMVDGGEVGANPSETTSVSLTNSAVGVITQTWEFTASTSNTGVSGISITATKDGKTLSKTFPDAVRVKDPQISGGSGGGGGGSSGGGGNPIPTTDLFTAATLSISGTVDPGQPKQVGVSLTHADGRSSTMASLLMPEVDRIHLINSEASIDADWNLYVAKPNQSVTLRGYGIGPIGDAGDPQEKWNKVTVSNNLTVTSSAAVYTGLWLGAPGFISMGEQHQLKLIDTETGQDVTSTATFSVDDASKADLQNDGGGRATILRGKSVGYFSITATSGSKSLTFKCRTLPGNPRVVSHFDSSGNFVTGVWDTHLRFGEPYRKNATTWVLPILCAGSKPTGFTKPAWFGPPNWASRDPMPALAIFLDAAGFEWGLHLYEFPDGTSTLNLDPAQYVGFWTSPINQADFGDDDKWKFSRDGEESYFWDEHTTSQGKGTDFLIQLRRSGSGGQLDPYAFRVTHWDKP